MKAKYINLLSLSLALLGFCFYSSCTDYDVKVDGSFYSDVTIEVDGLKNDTLFVNYFNKQQISVKAMPEDKDIVFDVRSFIYDVDDENILTIDESGNISNLALGTTEVSLVFRANKNVTTTCKICIWKEYIYIEKIMASAVNMKIGTSVDLKPTTTIVPEVADNKVLHYESLTPNIVTVDDDGIVTAITEGTGEIKVSATDGSGVSTICNVNVIAEVKVQDIKIPTALEGQTIGIGQTIDLGGAIVVTPSNADNKVLEYTILSGSDAITIDENGVIRTIGTGSVRLLISSTDDSDISKELSFTVDTSTLFNRALWTITTQTSTDYGHVVDGTTGLPEHVLDNNASTFLSLVKPGKSFGSVPLQSADFMPSFTVDMKTKQAFNYIMWRHRGSNTYNYLRVYGIEAAGSDNGEDFTPINGGQIIWVPNIGGYTGAVSKADPETYEIAIPESNYRYVMVKLVVWSDAYNGQHPDYAGAGATSGSSMQVAEFGVGKK